MRRKDFVRLGLGLIAAAAIALFPMLRSQVVAQSPPPPPSVPNAAPSPSSSPTSSPGSPGSGAARPSPTTPSLPSASPSPSPTSSPPASSPTPLPSPPVPAPAPSASSAAPLPLAEGNQRDYTDPVGRFKIGLLKEYRVSPLAGSVLVEAPDGNLAYAVVAQSQPRDNPIGLIPSFLNTDALAQVATTVLQRGEAFQPGPSRTEAGGGIVLDWSGSLTIGGKTQPVGGVVLVRPTPKQILLLIITATEAGSDRIQGALAALADTLKPL